METPTELDDSDGIIEAGVPFAPGSAGSNSSRPAEEPFAPVVATGQATPGASWVNPLGSPKAACLPTPGVPVSPPAPSGSMSEPARVQALLATLGATDREGVSNNVFRLHVFNACNKCESSKG